jgi:hypothetical protein
MRNLQPIRNATYSNLVEYTYFRGTRLSCRPSTDPCEATEVFVLQWIMRLNYPRTPQWDVR